MSIEGRGRIPLSPATRNSTHGALRRRGPLRRPLRRAKVPIACGNFSFPVIAYTENWSPVELNSVSPFFKAVIQSANKFTAISPANLVAVPATPPADGMP